MYSTCATVTRPAPGAARGRNRMRQRHDALVDDDTNHDDRHADDDSTLDVHPHLEQPGVSSDDGRYYLGHDARRALSNTGANPVAIGSVTDTNFQEFPWSTTCAANAFLQGGTSCSVTTQFKPSALGAQSATLVINANAQ